MEESNSPRKFKVGKITSSDNQGDGIRIEGDHEIEFGEIETSRNKGRGLSVVGAGRKDGSSQRWYEKIEYLFLAILAAVVAGSIIYFFGLS